MVARPSHSGLLGRCSGLRAGIRSAPANAVSNRPWYDSLAGDRQGDTEGKIMKSGSLGASVLDKAQAKLPGLNSGAKKSQGELPGFVTRRCPHRSRYTCAAP